MVEKRALQVENCWNFHRLYAGHDSGGRRQQQRQLSTALAVFGDVSSSVSGIGIANTADMPMLLLWATVILWF